MLGGDFRQTLPIVKKGSRAQTVGAAMHRSALWPNFEQFALTENMRVQMAGGERETLHDFAQWLLRLGEGTEPVVDGNDMIELPYDLCLQPTADGSVDEQALLEFVFPDLNTRAAEAASMATLDWFAERAVVTPRNTSVAALNAAMLSRFPGESTTCTSADALMDDDAQQGSGTCVPVEYLNAQATPGMPEHEFVFKRNMPIMLLRNLNPREGLCNGAPRTRRHTSEQS